MITCFSAQLVLWQSVRAIFPDKMEFSLIYLFLHLRWQVEDSLLMFNLELCLVSVIFSHQFLHEIIDAVLPELEVPYLTGHIYSLFTIQRTKACGKAVCSNSDRVCSLLLAWVSQSLGVIYCVCSSHSQEMKALVTKTVPTTWQYTVFIDVFGFNSMAAWMVGEREFSIST